MVKINYKKISVSLGLFLICCVIFITLLFMRGNNNDKKETLPKNIEKLLSNEIPSREAELEEQYKALKEYDGEYDIKNKFRLFEELIKLESNNYIYRAVHLLSLMPEDTKIINYAKDKLNDNDLDIGVLIGSLTYLENKRPELFEDYFKSKNYLDIKNTFVGNIFATSDILYKMRNEYYDQLINGYAQGVTKKSTEMVFDQTNPLRENILTEGKSIVPTIVSKYYNSSQTQIPLQIIWILGEIGDTNAFDLLLEEYLARPTERTGISLGSCLGSLNYKKLFDNTLINDTALRQLLMYIYGSKWIDVKNLSIQELELNMHDNLFDIVENCKKRSVPELG